MRLVRSVRSWLPALLILALFAAMGGIRQADADELQVTAHIFWQPGCLHCARAKEALNEIQQRIPGLQINAIELGASAETDHLFGMMLALLEVRDAAVPFVVIGSDWVVGFAGGGQTAGLYERATERCRVHGCVDLAAELWRLSGIATGRRAPELAAPSAPAPAPAPALRRR